MSQPERILVRGVNWLGDAVMTTPALQRLREGRPEAHIALLTHAKLADLWAQHPAVDSILIFQRGESVLSVARRLRAERFTTALVFPNSPRAALEVFLARIPRRIGLGRPWRNVFLTERIRPRRDAAPMRKRSLAEIQVLIRSVSSAAVTAVASNAHQLHEYLQLVAALGASPEPLPPHLPVTEAEVAEVRKRFGFRAEGSGGPRLFGLNAGAEYGPAKRWPRERFVAAAVELQRRTGCHWWIFGGPADAALASAIATEIVAAKGAPNASVRSLAGKTSLRELCAALKACDLLLTNDTGPMHVAAAVGTPVIVPFGSTSPELTGPGRPGDPRHRFLKANVPCSPCFRRECPIDFRCMQSISVDAVVAAALEVVGRR